MLNKIENLRTRLGLKDEFVSDISSFSQRMLTQADNFYQQMQRWGRVHCSGYACANEELILPSLYELLVSAEYGTELYSLVYRQTLHWNHIGLTDAETVVLYSKLRQLITSYAASFGGSRLAFQFNLVVDLCMSLSVDVYRLSIKMAQIKQVAEYESHRINQVFSNLSANLPSDLIKAYVKHQNWKYQVFSLAMGYSYDTVVAPLGIEECYLTRWVKQDRYKSIEPEPFNTLHHRVHELSDRIMADAMRESPEQISLYLDEFEQASDSLARLLLERLERFIAEMATHDQLTRLLNRTTLESVFARERALAERVEHNLGLILLDIDHFKSINDRYGHFVGDLLLVEFARVLEREIRTTDLVFRWGGEEFVIIGMVKPNAEQGMIDLAERIRHVVERTEFCKQMSSLNITVSAGVVEFPACSDLSLQRVFAQADTLLYRAKQSGRNQVQSILL